MACVKPNSKNLCATCKVTKTQVLGLGTKLHDLVYSSRKQEDGEREQDRIETARKRIYEYGYVADGKAIDEILGESKTPIWVRLTC
jgi:hypothetical protein